MQTLTKSILTVLFILAPTALAATSVALKLMYPQLADGRLDLLISMMGLLGLLCGLAGMVAGIWLWMQTGELQRRDEGIAVLHDINRELKLESHQLKNQVELLTAMREMALVTNDNTLFRESLGKIFAIMESLLECQSLTLCLLDEDADELKPRVYFDGEHTLFDGDIPPGYEEDDLVHNAFNYKRSFSSVDGGVLTTCSPLIADLEPIGVVQVSVDLSGDHEDQIEFIEKHQYRLEAISKHISLPIRKSYLFDEATLDVMTKLYTKRQFLVRLAEAFAVARQKGKPYSLILCDIDHFKKVNDNYGHQSGDKVLTGVSAVLLDLIRGSDTAYRYGGEEMAVLLLGAPGEKALEVAERIRATVESTELHGADGRHIPVTLSLGCCEFDPRMQSPDEIVELADQALYHCKEKGRNQAALRLAGEPASFEQPALIGLDRRQERPGRAKRKRKQPSPNE